MLSSFQDWGWILRSWFYAANCEHNVLLRSSLNYLSFCAIIIYNTWTDKVLEYAEDILLTIFTVSLKISLPMTQFPCEMHDTMHWVSYQLPIACSQEIVVSVLLMTRCNCLCRWHRHFFFVYIRFEGNSITWLTKEIFRFRLSVTFFLV